MFGSRSNLLLFTHAFEFLFATRAFFHLIITMDGFGFATLTMVPKSNVCDIMLANQYPFAVPPDRSYNT